MPFTTSLAAGAAGERVQRLALHPRNLLGHPVAPRVLSSFDFAADRFLSAAAPQARLPLCRDGSQRGTAFITIRRS